MTERPILFSGPMVRELLAGRKTQTRRPAKWKAIQGFNLGFYGLQPGHYMTSVESSPWVLYSRRGDGVWEQRTETLRCPYGAPGDRLWVREAWFEEFYPITCKPYVPPRACYRATHDGEVRKMDGDGGTVFRKNGEPASPWRPGIHMPRWASRLTLEVTSVRVERLQAITEEDARAEGFERREHFLRAWTEMYGGSADPLSVEADPWVWVVSFRRVEAP